jgi:TonB family protein
VYAVYYDALRRKVEDKGTENFPENKGKKLYGELVMILTVNHDGRVLSTEVVQGSGNRMLDTRAEAIARAAGPTATSARPCAPRPIRSPSSRASGSRASRHWKQT